MKGLVTEYQTNLMQSLPQRHIAISENLYRIT